ncbi:hypothetical protein H4R19_001404, partial [Coemansia spiralis]
MQICDLPEDILVIVLSRCLSNDYDAATRLKCNLPLLAVCRLWRRLAAPMEYDHAFVQYGKKPDIRAPLSRDTNVEEPTDVAVTTNLDLIAMVNGANAVKSMKIDVHYLVNPFPGWRNAIQRMRTVATKWRVVELNVAMHPDVSSFGDNNGDVVKYTGAIAEVGDALTVMMPN